MLKHNVKKHIAGFTLTEILIALALNALLFTAVIAIFIANVDHYRRTLNSIRLHQQLHTALFIMTSEIRRAGYWANASSDIGGLPETNNPFMQTGTDISINGSGNCILFSYDHDQDGTLPAVNATIDDERYGYRLLGTTLQARPAGANFACNASANAWESMLDDNAIQITNLTFTPNVRTINTGPGTKGITIRAVTISITGRVASDTSISKTLTQYVKVRNDKSST